MIRSRKMIREQKQKTASGYPSMSEIDTASRTRLAFWMRYLDSPGASSLVNVAAESAAIEWIALRFKLAGGWSPRVSKGADAMAGRR